MPARTRMSSVDTAWLRMDRATNRMAILGVLLFAAPLDFDRLEARIEKRLLRFARFRQRPVEDSTGAWWEDCPRFDLARHVKRVRLPRPGGAEALRRLAGRLAAQPFDPRRPWWEFHLVESYGAGSALVMRIHHSYADGIALVRVMLSLADDAGGAAASATSASDAPDASADAGARRTRRASGDTGVLGQVFEPLGDLVAGARRLSGGALDRSLEILRNPEKALGYAAVAGRVGGEIAYLATMPDDSRTRFKGKAGVAKAVAWTHPLPLDEVKAVGKVLECSVNDVLLSTVAGALRRYLVAKGDDPRGTELRAMVPVNLRADEPEIKLGNRFGLVTLLLPVGIANPLARLYEVHHRMEALKRSYQAPIALALIGLAGLAPRVVQQQFLDVLANKATAVMTNVPGPQHPVYIAGSLLDGVMFWVPQSGDIGMGVSILSYNGKVQFGLVTDAGRVPDPEAVIAEFRPEFDRLLMTVLMEPWDMQRDPALVERELQAVLRGTRGTGARRGSPRRKRPSARGDAVLP